MKLINETVDISLHIEYHSEKGRILINNDDGYLIIEAIAEYIPIDEFKALFNKAAEIAKNNRYNKCIFDKRQLKIFHQPSMEWYYTSWKKELYDYGIKKHRKILPGLDWFNKSVEAGKKEIFAKYDLTFLNDVEVKYMHSIQDAINY